MSKNTVKSYLKKMADGGFNTGQLLKQDDPLLEKSFHPSNPAYKTDKFQYLKSRLDYYEKELKRTGGTKLLLWQEYIENEFFLRLYWPRYRFFNNIQLLYFISFQKLKLVHRCTNYSKSFEILNN